MPDVMEFQKPLKDGIFLKRYKRFFADVIVDGEVVVAHVANSGSMKTACAPERPCRITFHNDPKRKLKATLEMIQMPSGWVGVNTSHPNLLAWEAWEKHLLPHWRPFLKAQREVKISDSSRIDMVLWNPIDNSEEPLKYPSLFKNENQRYHFVEVKNVSLAQETRALFPDSVTERGQKHLRELMDLMAKGHTCEMVYVIQRENITEFAPADDIDPAYGQLLREAISKGLTVTPLICALTRTGIELSATAVPLKID